MEVSGDNRGGFVLLIFRANELLYSIQRKRNAVYTWLNPSTMPVSPINGSRELCVSSRKAVDPGI